MFECQKKLILFFQQVRGSLYKKDISEHVHDYGEEIYNETEDEYSRTCSTCGHVHSYEKMWSSELCLSTSSIFF